MLLNYEQSQLVINTLKDILFKDIETEPSEEEQKRLCPEISLDHHRKFITYVIEYLYNKLGNEIEEGAIAEYINLLYRNSILIIGHTQEGRHYVILKERHPYLQVLKFELTYKVAYDLYRDTVYSDLETFMEISKIVKDEYIRHKIRQRIHHYTEKDEVHTT